MPRPLKHKIEVGQKFGRLVTIECLGMVSKRTTWKCECKCGVYKNVIASDLLSGHTSSCGCSRILKIKTHGKSQSKAYKIWIGIKSRCYNPKATRYEHYGGKGIKMCNEWVDSFENFYKDMGDPPKGLTIHRKDNGKDYCKNNCIWTTPKIQANFRTNNRLLTFNNKTQTIMQWSEETGLGWKCIQQRIDILNWPIEKALTIPPDSNRNRKLKF